MTSFRSIILTVIGRGLRKQCPQCGSSGLFERWYTLAPACPHCQLDLRSSEGDTWAFMYFSTAALTGLFVVTMFLIRPANTASGRMVILLSALFVILGSLPRRKSLALGLDYLIAYRWDNYNNTKCFRLHSSVEPLYWPRGETAVSRVGWRW